MPNEPQSGPGKIGGLLDLVPDIVSVVDAEGRYLLVSSSAERIHGYASEELIGRSSLDFIHPEDHPAVAMATAKAFASPGTTVSARYRYLDKDGGYRWIEGTGNCGRGDDGRLVLVIVSRDATRQVEAESRLGQTLREKDALLHEIQHRVKNSVAMISSFVALEEGRTDPGPLRSVLENLRFRVDSISTLYRLLFSTGKPTVIDLKAYMEKLVFDIAQTIDRPGVSMRLELSEFSLDTKRAVPLGLLCTELVANALRHGYDEDGEGSLHVRMTAEEGRLALDVENDGRDLPEDFDLDTQDGLGLQIARMLSLQLKGRLTAARREGGGARFFFDMPREAIG